MSLFRPAVKDYLFWEIEPSCKCRSEEPCFDREGARKIELRLEFLLFDNPSETLERQVLWQLSCRGMWALLLAQQFNTNLELKVEQQLHPSS